MDRYIRAARTDRESLRNQKTLMIRRLVKPDPETGGRFTEVDPTLIREAVLGLKDGAVK